MNVTDGLDCAVIHYPIGPSTPRSLEYLAHSPIGPATPAFLLAMKGPAPWSGVGSTANEGTHLSALVRRLAHLTEPSLVAISEAWRRSTGNTDNATCVLPACAMPIGIIYDAKEIHFIAHIAYSTEGTQRFLSLRFDTLPFPCKYTGLAADFVRSRYRVALALLSIQQHIFRPVTLAESFIGAPSDPESRQRVFTLHRLERLGWRKETPTPSFCSSEASLSSAYTEGSEDAVPPEESEDDGESVGAQPSLVDSHLDGRSITGRYVSTSTLVRLCSMTDTLLSGTDVATQTE